MNKRITTHSFKKMKEDKEKITILTAYDYPTANILDDEGIDALLVGDSLGMVVLGYEDTTQVTIEDMIHHIKAVSRGAKRSMVIGDMPFVSYHISKEQSVINAGRLIQEGQAKAVKLEGGKEIVEDVKAIAKAGIPVMGHIGLTPQSVHQLGGYFIQGKTKEQSDQLLEDAKALEEAGAFAIVLECVTEEVAEMITNHLKIPTIGIGAGRKCDGQVLVTHDMIGFYHSKSPRFAKRYVDLHEQIRNGVHGYIKEVKENRFPQEEHVFKMNSQELDKLYGKGESL
ncbi:ketopantoate hydroxymethyltransferase [Natranaerovirga hydrolytica]|uniref:3-methyl-2-oxobutanoate hydroxymethyltransferase n=1 Tax=Natranaerovirga hydrolytica TaxID=680378 RepID=A0A4R1M9B0_9FIRM|nr:3-methyl-2-oxobutanoate hydroxymethyltransferase [Natranaerovirga hydrolytica]TCK88002.1 ketopantoate hydroxymethyltransferase [Natranaerovirga hydrolytica]